MAEGQDKATRQEQGKEDNSEVYVNRLIQYQLPQAITRKLLRKETSKDETLQMLVEDIKLGKCTKHYTSTSRSLRSWQ